MALALTKDDPAYRMCSKTVMDNLADPDISFDENGVCNYVFEYDKAERAYVAKGEAGERKINDLVKKMKAEGRGKPYDCLIGLSGGVDSTYVAYLISTLGLRPLAVHLDNGWNSELAVMNIENIVKKLGIDLFTLVVDWEEFKDIQLAYLKASVVDIEIVSDHAIIATMYKLAKEKSIKYIISGSNIVTEHIMPPSWIYSKTDFANLKDIYGKFGSRKLKTYPTLDFKKYLYYTTIGGLKSISILDYVEYNKLEAKKKIASELSWRDYGGKHYESIFTKFYQAYILPEKFKIDKRKPHLSTLICSGQISRETAMNELKEPLYLENELRRDKEYVIKKLGLKESEFDQIMKSPTKSHADFASDRLLKERYMNFLIKTKDIRKVLKRKK